MAVIESTGWAVLKAAAFAAAFQNGCIEVYSGVQPASADLPPNGTLLGRITKDGAGWTAGSPTNGLRWLAAGRFAIQDPTQVWILKGLATGTAQSFRVLPNAADSGAPSIDALRADGAVGVTDDIGATDVQLFLPSTAITAATSRIINNWWYAVPPLGA